MEAMFSTFHYLLKVQKVDHGDSHIEFLRYTFPPLVAMGQGCHTDSIDEANVDDDIP